MTTLTQVRVYEYVAVLASDEVIEQDGHPVPADVQTVFPVFTNQPSSEDWEQWLEGWQKAGYHLLSKPHPTTSIEDEF